MRGIRIIGGALFSILVASSALAASTVNPNVPATNDPLNSAPIRGNFAATANDINNILGEFAGSSAPLNPIIGQHWRKTNVTPQQEYQWTGTAWAQSGTFDVVNNQITPYFGNSLLTWQQLMTGSGGLGSSGQCVTSRGGSLVPTMQNCVSAGTLIATEPLLWNSGTLTLSFDYAHAGVFTALQSVNLNAGSLQAVQIGTVLRVAQADGVTTRIELDAYAAVPRVTFVRADGTAASPTTIQSGDEIGSLNSFGYNGTSFVGPNAAVRTYASQNWSVGSNGTYMRFGVTPNGSSTLTDALGIEQNGGVTLGSTLGTSAGANTLNLPAAGLYNSGVAPTGSGGGYVLSTSPSISALTVTSSFSATGLVTNTDLATMSTNTVKGNATSGTASPTDLSIGSCSTASSALLWTTNTGFSCNTSITANAVPAANLTGSTLAAGVTSSSITSVGTLVGGVASTGFTIQASNTAWTGAVPSANLPLGSASVFGAVKCDNTTITCSAGVITAVGGVATSVQIGATTITSGTNAYILYDNSGILGNEAATSIAFGTGTLNLAGNLSTTGAFASIFSASGAYTYTLPPGTSTFAAMNLTGQLLTGGARVTSYNVGSVSSGTTTIDPGNGPQQRMINTGASTIAAPATTVEGSLTFIVTNGSGAGAITLSGFVKIYGAFSTTATASASCTFTNASPAVVTYTAHGLVAGQKIYVTGTMPGGFTSGQIYYLVPTIATNTFELAATPGGTPINSSSTGSGLTCTVPSVYGLVVEETDGNPTATWYQKQ